MNRVSYPRDEFDLAYMLHWAAERIGVQAFRPDAKAIALADDTGELAAVCVFDGFSPVDVNMHIASDGTKRWLTRAYLTACFAYPFVQCRLRRVTGLVPATNRAALRFDEGLGFRREGYHPRACEGGGDLISLGMLREHCRYISAEHRQ